MSIRSMRSALVPKPASLSKIARARYTAQQFVKGSASASVRNVTLSSLDKEKNEIKFYPAACVSELSTALRATKATAFAAIACASNPQSAYNSSEVPWCTYSSGIPKRTTREW